MTTLTLVVLGLTGNQACNACAAIRALARQNKHPMSGPSELAPHHLRIHNEEIARYMAGVQR